MVRACTVACRNGTAPNNRVLAPRKARNLGSGENSMQWVGVPQWVSTWWCKSPLTNAEPTGPERPPRASPAMGGRSWRERGGRPREGAPQGGESWSAGAPQRGRGTSRRCARTGRHPSWGRYRRGRRTPPGSESGAGLQRGHAGTWEHPRSPRPMPGGGDRATPGPEPDGATTNAVKQARYREGSDE